MRIGPSAIAARLNVAETITALWTFANALGLRTDDINERTADAGVTIEAVLFRDGFVLKNNAAVETNAFIATRVLADAQDRFLLRIGGVMEWGDGVGGRDTILQRDAANELGTPDDFNIGGVLDLAGDIELAERTITLAAGANDDVGTGLVTTQRLTVAVGPASITGFAGGRPGRLILVQNIGPVNISLMHEDIGSLAINRLTLPSAIDLVANVNDGFILRYDTTLSRWFTLTETL